MPLTPSTTKPTRRAAAAPESVESFLAALDHPLNPEILAIRQMILDADPSIAEGIKWNTPSFRTSEYFATLHLRSQAGVQVILHFGAKKRDTPGVAISDPESLLNWLADDRASVTFRDLASIEANRAAFTSILRAWITYV